MVNQTETTALPFPSILPTEPPLSTDDRNRTKRLRQSQRNLTQIQQDLDSLVDTMANNPSMLSRASTYWGNISLWQKIVAGTVLVAPTLLLSIIANLIVCLAISAFTLIAYVATSIVLDDHHAHSQHSTQNIKSGVSNLAAGLDAIMGTLEQIGEELAQQIALFERGNEQFSERLTSLQQRNESLCHEIATLQKTIYQLNITETELHQASDSLTQSLTQQSTLLQENQEALSKARIDYERTQKELHEKVEEIALFNTELEKQKAIAQRLRSALSTVTETLHAEGPQKEAMYQQLEKFFTDTETYFSAITERTHKAEQRLIDAQDTVTKLIQEREQRISLTEQEIQRQIAALARKLGLYAEQQAPSPLGECAARAETLSITI